MKKTVRLIINPSSGNHNGKRLIQKITSQLKRLGLDADACLTEAPGHAQELARQAVIAGYDTIAIYGGDGTICEVVNGAVPSGVNLGLIPGGKGNDLASYLGIPTRLEQACEIISGGCIRKLDLARVENPPDLSACPQAESLKATDALNGFGVGTRRNINISSRLFCTVGCLGLPAKVARRVNQGSQGKFAYINYLFREIVNFQPFPLRIEYPEGVYEGKVMLAAVGNTTCFGGGFKITPLASAEDGLLDVCVIEQFAKLSLGHRLPRVFLGRHLDYPFVKYWRTSRIELSSPQPAEFFADGEYFQTLPLKVNIESKVVNFLLPK